MTPLKVLRDSIGAFTVTVSVNGRSRSSVILYDTSSANPDQPVLADELNLSNADARRRFLARLPETIDRTQAEECCLRLAAGVIAEQAAGTGAAEGGKPVLIDESPAEHIVDGCTLAREIQRRLERYIVLPPGAATMLAIWIMHSYVTDVTDYTPYLWVTSPVRECGKSVLLELLSVMAHNAQLSGGYTAAALYRRIARNPATTMLLDEIDARLRTDGGEAIRGVLNTGFHRSGKMTICVGDDHEDKDFPTFCPKVLAGIGNMWDTVASRSIPVRMSRASKDELRQLTRIRGDRIRDECQPIRRQLLRWAQDASASLRASDPDVPDVLGARHADVWRPLLAIGDQIGAEWPTELRRSALMLHHGGGDETDYGLLLLGDVRDLLGNENAIFTEALLSGLVQREDRPWPEYRHDRPITARGVASLLGRFGVKPGTVRVSAATGKGYSRDKLAPAFSRYLNAPTPAVLSVTSVTPDAVTDVVTDSSRDVTDETSRNSAMHNDVTDVTDSSPSDGPTTGLSGGDDSTGERTVSHKHPSHAPRVRIVI